MNSCKSCPQNMLENLPGPLGRLWVLSGSLEGPSQVGCWKHARDEGLSLLSLPLDSPPNVAITVTRHPSVCPYLLYSLGVPPSSPPTGVSQAHFSCRLLQKTPQAARGAGWPLRPQGDSRGPWSSSLPGRLPAHLPLRTLTLPTPTEAPSSAFGPCHVQTPSLGKISCPPGFNRPPTAVCLLPELPLRPETWFKHRLVAPPGCPRGAARRPASPKPEVPSPRLAPVPPRSPDHDHSTPTGWSPRAAWTLLPSLHVQSAPGPDDATP